MTAANLDHFGGPVTLINALGTHGGYGNLLANGAHPLANFLARHLHGVSLFNLLRVRNLNCVLLHNGFGVRDTNLISLLDLLDLWHANGVHLLDLLGVRNHHGVVLHHLLGVRFCNHNRLLDLLSHGHTHLVCLLNLLNHRLLHCVGYVLGVRNLDGDLIVLNANLLLRNHGRNRLLTLFLARNLTAHGDLANTLFVAIFGAGHDTLLSYILRHIHGFSGVGGAAIGGHTSTNNHCAATDSGPTAATGDGRLGAGTGGRTTAAISATSKGLCC